MKRKDLAQRYNITDKDMLDKLMSLPGNFRESEKNVLYHDLRFICFSDRDDCEQILKHYIQKISMSEISVLDLAKLKNLQGDQIERVSKVGGKFTILRDGSAYEGLYWNGSEVTRLQNPFFRKSFDRFLKWMESKIYVEIGGEVFVHIVDDVWRRMIYFGGRKCGLKKDGSDAINYDYILSVKDFKHKNSTSHPHWKEENK